MSLATELTNIQKRMTEAEQKASAFLREHKAVIPPTVYSELQLHLIVVASEATKLKITLGSMRMVGDLDQQPPEVTAESLELAECVPMIPRHPIIDQREAFALELQHIGDDTLSERSAA